MATIGSWQRSATSTGRPVPAPRTGFAASHSKVHAAVWRFAVIGVVAFALVGEGTGWLRAGTFLGR